MTIAHDASPPVRLPQWIGRWRENLPFILITAFLLFLILVPIVRLIINSFQLGHPAMPQGFSLRNYQNAFASPLFYQALATTFLVSTIGTVITVVISVLFAWLIERTDMPCRNLAWALILIPMAMPGVLFALAWTLLLAPKSAR